MSDEKPAVVIDCGTGVCKSGFAGDDAPISNFPTIFGKDSDSNYVGQEAQMKSLVSYPVEHGIVTNWNEMEHVYKHIFKELHVKSEDQPVLLSQPPLNPKSNKEKLTEVIFEKFNVPSVFEAVDPVLSLYASGRHAGLIVDIGDGVATAVPIEGGYPIPEGILRLDLAGRDLTDFLKNKLNHQGTLSIDRETARDIKETLCYVSLDAVEKPTQQNYVLPNGETITVDEEITSCPEVLFAPKKLNKEANGIQHIVYDSIMKCSIDLRRQFANNIILAGGTTMFKNFEERLKRELEAKVPKKMAVNVLAQDYRKFSVWIGGSILGSLSSFKSACISRQEYDEYGASRVHSKFFGAIP